MEPDVSFVGVKLLPGKKTKVGGTTNPESSIWTLHITQFALAAGAKPGKNVIGIVQDNGESFALGTLEKDRCEQFQGDFMLSQEVHIVNHGKSEVHLTGYQTTTDLMDPEIDIESEEEEENVANGQRRLAAIKAMHASGNGLLEDEDDSDEDEDFDAGDEIEEEDDEIIDGDEDDDDDDDAPVGVPLSASDAQKLIQAQRKGKRALELAEEGADDSDSDELDDEEDEMLRDAALEGGEETDEDDDDDEELDDEPMDDDDDDDSDVDVTNEDDKKEEEELLTASKILKKQKRSSEAGKAAPQPNKKAKIDSNPSTPAANDADKQWSKELKAYLAKEGATPISNLGSRVKKPPGVHRKLKKLLEDSKDFVLDANGVVSLAS